MSERHCVDSLFSVIFTGHGFSLLLVNACFLFSVAAGKLWGFFFFLSGLSPILRYLVLLSLSVKKPKVSMYLRIQVSVHQGAVALTQIETVLEWGPQRSLVWHCLD